MKQRSALIMSLITMGMLSAHWTSAENYTFEAKKMKITNTTTIKSDNAFGVAKNWFINGEYVMLSTTGKPNGEMNSTGSVGFSPASDDMIADGEYTLTIDICHADIKLSNDGAPPAARDGSFSYRLILAKGAKGKLTFTPECNGWVTHFPQDPDNCGGTPYHGIVALTDFVAYGPACSDKKAQATITLAGVKASELVFEIWDQVIQNYGEVGLASFTLFPVIK